MGVPRLERGDSTAPPIAVEAAYPRISVIIPARNEANNLPHVLPHVPSFVSEIILVDGHSTDDTIAVARRIAPSIRVVHQTGRGKGDALRCGFDASTGDIVVMIDADGSTDPREIPQFVRALLAGADFVKGSRFLTGGGSADLTRIRRLGNLGLNLTVNVLFGSRFTDLCYGYNAFWKDCLQCFVIDCSGFEVETLMNVRARKARLRIVEVPSYEHSRIYGESNLHAVRDGLRVLRTICAERLNGGAVVRLRGELLAHSRGMLGGLPGLAGTDAATEAADAIAQAEEIVAETGAQARSALAREIARQAEPVTASVSVVISCYTLDRWSDLVAAVKSLRRQSLRPGEVLVVVDHNPALYERVRTRLRDVVALENSGQRGLSGARNTGVARATGDFIAFLDDDAIAEPDWLERLARATQRDGTLGAGGWIEPLWQSGKPAWFPDEFAWVVGCGYEGLPRGTEPVRNLIGASMCIRREVFVEAGGFREDVGRVGTRPMGCEETELCVRARQRWPERGFLYEPAARVRHRVPASRATFRYFAARCYAEGRSKALVVDSVGSRDGLAAERAYTLRTLPRGVLRGLADATLRRDAAGLGRAGAIAAGLALTAGGYATGRAARWNEERKALWRRIAAFRAVPAAADDEKPSFAPLDEAPLDAPLTRPLRVLLVTARYFPLMGGVETHCYEVGRRLASAGAEVTVLTTDPSGKLPRREVVEGIRVRRVRAWPAKKDYYFAPAIWRAIRRGGWDVVHVQGCHTLVAPLAMLAARSAHIPYVLTFHTGGHSSRARTALRRVQWALLRPLLAGAAKLIGVSRFEAGFFSRTLRLPAERFAVVPNGGRLPAVPDSSDTEAARDAAENGSGPLIVSVGRLERYKGHQRVIAALPHLRRLAPGARLRIVGAGPYKAELLRLADELGVADSVEIGAIAPGDRSGMARVLARADLVTLLSDYEAHPIAAMEALALERKVLVADTSGLSELAEQGLARAVPLDATPEAVAEAIARQIGEPAPEAALELPTWESCVAKIATVYAASMRRSSCAF